MPKVKLGADRKKEIADRRRKLVDGKAHFRGYQTKVALETAIGVGRGWLSDRYKGEREWKLDDIVKLDNVLRFDADELASLVRGR